MLVLNYQNTINDVNKFIKKIRILINNFSKFL